MHTGESLSDSNIVSLLRLLHLADSVLPIGGLSHSFGLESMIEDHMLEVDDLFSYFQNLLEESLLLEGVYCRTGHCAASTNCADLSDINSRLSALRPARESREASLALGRRFLRLVAFLHPSTQICAAIEIGDVHFSVAFGYACGVLGFEADQTVAAFLHQNVAASLSAAQRLLPLGQMQSSQMLWELKSCIEHTVERSAGLNIDSASAFSHLPEVASMRHPLLPTRLFVS